MRKYMIVLIIVVLLLFVFIAVKYNNHDYYIKFNYDKVDTNYKDLFQDNIITLNKSGNYYLTGISTNYGIRINSDDVTLIMEDLNLEYNDIVINVIESKNVSIKVKGVSKLTSLNNNVIYSNSNLIINGGNLELVGKQGIKGEKKVIVDGANIKINATGDGIEANDIEIDKTNINIITNGSYILDSEGRYILKEGKYYKVAKENVDKYKELFSLKESCKGLNVNGDIIVNKSTLNINSTDDNINAKGKMFFDNSEIVLSTDDDGISSVSEISINNCNINIINSFEGIEGNKIILKNNDINIFSFDDGINIKSENENLIDNNANSFVIDKNNIIINANGDGFDILGNIKIYDSNIELNVLDEGIQCETLYMDGVNLKIYTTVMDNYAIIANLKLENSDIVLGQVHNDFGFKPEWPYIEINSESSFEIINDKNIKILGVDKDCKYYIYLNNDLDINVNYYLIDKNGKNKIQIIQ